MTQPSQLPLIVEPEELLPLLSNPDILLIDLSRQEIYLQHHLPGAHHITPQQLMSGQPPAPGKLPAKAQIEQLLSSIGFTGEQHVVVYDDEGGGWAGRFIWTLDVIGHKRHSYLNGGLHAWLGHSLPVTAEMPPQPKSTQVSVTIDTTPIADVDYIKSHLNTPSFVVWDARSPAEYQGIKVLAQRGGHIPGAINFEWTRGMDQQNYLKIRDDIQKLLADCGITADKTIVTHCQSHHRSGFTYLVAKSLGFKNIKAYDGSWSEWGNLADTPIEK
ncbi:sulfurtransferase [Spartinivicinus marinus]|uniref:sulfurtransferase n=1 Tax=Spartinivicinus marinus TaxID=2994442 RepID=UPI001C5CB36E|nr:rhodanese-like domain-containing protein [Spartinivicinus marinus]MCX4027584.1 rhodanese-like domain-containing protein [Spartinivicinus marinus]